MGFLSNIFKKKFYDRDYRFAVNELHDLSIAVNGCGYNVTNISISGLCIRSKELAENYKINDELIVSFRINKKILDFSVRIARKEKDDLGLAITSNLSLFQKEVKVFFDCEIKGIKVKEKDTHELYIDGEDNIHWYSYDHIHEILITENNSVLTSFWINFQNIIFAYSESKEFKAFPSSSIGNNLEILNSIHFSRFIHDVEIFNDMKLDVKRFVLASKFKNEELSHQIINIIDSQS